MEITPTSLIMKDARVRSVIDIDPYPLKTAMVFPDAASADIERQRALLGPEHMLGDEIFLTIQSFVLEIDGKIVLVDACAGEHKVRSLRPLFNQRANTGFLGRLTALGVKPEQVDIVMCTHLHVDHVGWNTQLRDGRWVPTFPNARYVMGRKEYAHWEKADDMHGCFKDSVLPIVQAGRADMVEDGHEMMKGVTLRPLPGHTPGQLGLNLDRPGAKALFAGDAIHHPIQLAHPELSTGFCVDKAAARASREGMLASVADSGAVLVPAHFRNCCGWQIERHGAGYRKVA